MVDARRALEGWRVLVTRPRAQSAPLARALAEAGAIPILYPTIDVGPPPSWGALDAALDRSADYAWVIFSSPSAVRFTMDRVHVRAMASPFAGARVAAVGAQTARSLAEYGLHAEVCPEEQQRQEGLLGELVRLVEPGARVLFPQALGGRDLLATELAGRGVLVEVVPVSQTVPIPLDVPPPPFDAAVFASPSALRALVSAFGTAMLTARRVVAIGPTTADAAAELQVRVDAVAKTPSVPGLLEALIRSRSP